MANRIDHLINTIVPSKSDTQPHIKKLTQEYVKSQT